MQKRSSKKRLDINELAKAIVEQAAAASEAASSADSQSGENLTSTKNPAAVALGRLGGKKGGPARAAKLSKKKRAEIARKAAKTRWRKSRK
jgi:hypothetical protein